MAMLSHEAACKTADALAKIPGVKIVNKSYFNEFTLRLPTNATEIVEALAAKGVLGGVPGARLWPHDPATHNLLIVAATECVADRDIETFALKLGEVL
jgi:glycine dehydrogenase subunit 1